MHPEAAGASAPRNRLQRRLTALGLGTCLLAGAVAAAAVATGNNRLTLALGALLAPLLLDLVLGAWNLRNLEIGRRLPAELFAGRRSQGALLLANHRRALPAAALALRELGAGEAHAHAAWLAPGASLELPAAWRFPDRGTCPLEGLLLCSRFPFGLIEHALLLRRETEVLVYPEPRFRPGRERRRTLGSRQADDDLLDPRRAGAGDFLDLREYQPGDPPRLIHWPTSARLGRPMVVLRGTDSDEEVAVRLTPEADPVRWEDAIAEACGQVLQHIRLGRAVCLEIGRQRWPARRGAAQQRLLLQVLARLPRPDEGSAP